MATRGRRPGGRQAAVSPKRKPSPGHGDGQEPSLEREQMLMKQVQDLQKDKETEEKEKKKEEALRKKELTAAKKALTKEVQASAKAVKKYEQELSKLSVNVKKLQGQELDFKKKGADAENKLKEKLHVADMKQMDLKTKLAQRSAEAAQEKVKLQELQVQLDALSNNHPLPSLNAAALQDDTGSLAALADPGAETTDAETLVLGEERRGFAEPEAQRLAIEIAELKLQHTEAEKQRQTLMERIAEVEQGGLALDSEDLHRECREAMEAFKAELERLREENEGLHAKLGAANKAIELQEECIEELAGRASGIGEGLMNIASQELARCSIIQGTGRPAGDLTHHIAGHVSAEERTQSQRPEGEECWMVGDFVRLNSDSSLVQEILRSVGLAWNEQANGMLGQFFRVVEVPKPGIVGLPSPDGSQGGVWYFPIEALQRALSEPSSPNSASATAVTTATHDHVRTATLTEVQQRNSMIKGAQMMPAASGSNASLIPEEQRRASTLGGCFASGSSGRPSTGSFDSSASIFGKTGCAAQGYAAQRPVGSVTPGRQVAAHTPASTVWLSEQDVGHPTPSSRGGDHPGATALEASSPTSASVFVGLIPAETSDEQLATEFMKFGAIKDMHVQRDDSRPQTLYAGLTYQTGEEAARAVEATSGGTLILPGAARACEVSFGRSAHVSSSAQVSGGAQIVSPSIPAETPDDSLMGELSKYGKESMDMQTSQDLSMSKNSVVRVTHQSREEAAGAFDSTTHGRLVLPGASAPCEAMTHGRLELPGAAAPCEAERTKSGAAVNFQINHNSPRSWASVTNQSRDEAPRVVEVGGSASTTQPAAGQAMIPAESMAIRSQQARAWSAPRTHSGFPVSRSGTAGLGSATGCGGAFRHEATTGHADGGEGACPCAWAAPDPRRPAMQHHVVPDPLGSSGPEMQCSAADWRYRPGPSHEPGASASTLASRQMRMQWQANMPSEPVAGMAPSSAELQHFSPSQRFLAVPGVDTLIPGVVRPGSHLAPPGMARGLSSPHHVLPSFGQGTCAMAVRSARSPGHQGFLRVTSPARHALFSPDGRPHLPLQPGVPPTGVMVIPAPGASPQGSSPSPCTPQAYPTYPREFVAKALPSCSSQLSSTPSSYIPPVTGTYMKQTGGQSPAASTPGMVPSPVASHTSNGVAAAQWPWERPPLNSVDALGSEAELGGARKDFREVVTKATARALREYRERDVTPPHLREHMRPQEDYGSLCCP